MVNWESHRLPENLPLYDYAPDGRVVGEYVYFCATKDEAICNFYRTKDILEGPYEEIAGTFNFKDPNLFVDDDGSMYFYWGLSSDAPIWGVELDPLTMTPIGEKQGLLWSDPFTKGFERIGEDNAHLPLSEEVVNAQIEAYAARDPQTAAYLQDPTMRSIIKAQLSKAPYIEGAWMDKFEGKYYLQYAFAGTHYNIYGDGVYVSEHPLGPFTLAKNNPYSYKPGGFIPGAGHGSTLKDKYGNLWHASTMRISMNHQFERRVGIWPAGIDQEGELFCNQRYGDWPMAVANGNIDPWQKPEWYLLSYQKPVYTSSYTEDKGPERVADENVRTWWQAEKATPGEWLEMDLEKAYQVHAIQINFADDKLQIDPMEQYVDKEGHRYIAEETHKTCWVLEGSLDQKAYFVIEDKGDATTDLPHDLVRCKEGIKVRYLRLTIKEVPYGQKPCISGLRVFGTGDGAKPEAPAFTATRISNIDMNIAINPTGAIGYNILWGHAPDKLYHSCMVFDTEKCITALVKDQAYYVRIDAFNENGITEGNRTQLVKTLY